jgi:hypothetical protein
VGFIKAGFLNKLGIVFSMESVSSSFSWLAVASGWEWVDPALALDLAPRPQGQFEGPQADPF